jgi:SAM-dependent methyltransferase
LPPGRLLEVGCAHGALVKLLDLAGFEAVGMEMDDSIVRKARAWFDIEVVEGPVESMPEDTKKFDVVVMLDVLEHLPQPLDTVRAIVRLLKPDGLLVIQSPEYQKDRKGSWQNFVVPEHLFLFTRESVCKLLREVGLDHVRFETPIFPNDFFLFASAQPFSPITVEKIEAALCSSADGRIALGMLDLWTENSKRKSLPYPLRAVRQVLKHLRNSLRGGVRKPKDR